MRFSIKDFWLTHFGDPTFEYHAAVARMWILAAVRLADSAVIPFDYRPYADKMSEPINRLRTSHPELDVTPLLSAIDAFALASQAYLFLFLILYIFFKFIIIYYYYSSSSSSKCL